jgi:NADH-ubiquinone oxidoreductase chain 2
MLLAISVDSIESMQAFTFYLMQYSLSNINAFVIIIGIGYTMYMYTQSEKEKKSLVDEENSPIQYIAQLKGYFYINPILAISFTIVIFSFVGIPPLVGFFGKQMVLSSALDKGYVFISLIAILTSVISAVYYLNIIKEIFFTKPDFDPISLGIVKNNETPTISLSMNISTTISVLTLIILLFMINPEQ